MRSRSWLAVVGVLAFALGTGCNGAGAGSSGTSGSGSTGSASTTGSTSGSTSAGSTSAGSTGGTGGNPQLTAVNGCDPSTATDLRGQSAVTIAFGGNNGLKYTPPCIIVGNGPSGVQVTFSGAFSSHPLTPGTNCTAASGASAITATHSGTSKTFTIAPAGGVPYSVPYFCAAHCASAAMQGAIYVE